MRIACSGAGPAGLYLAIAAKLQDERNEVRVFERNPRGVTYGWGVVFWSSLLDRLRRHDSATASALEERSYGWSGMQLHVSGTPPVRTAGGGYGIARQTLLDVLDERATELGVELEFEHEIATPGDLPDADLVVAADGASSRLRALHERELEPTIGVGRNSYVWLGTSKVFDAFTFGFARTDAGWIWLHAYAFEPGTSTVIVECAPETWSRLGFAELRLDEGLRLLEEIFAEQLEGHRLRSNAREGDRLPWLNFRLVACRSWHAGNFVLVGDAAHTAHFSIGSGTRLAIEDAIALSDRLASADVPAALAAYERERHRAVARAQRDAGRSAHWFENVPRYAELEPSQLLDVLLVRRSALVHRLPPRAYSRTRRVVRGLAS